MVSSCITSKPPHHSIILDIKEKTVTYSLVLLKGHVEHLQDDTQRCTSLVAHIVSGETEKRATINLNANNFKFLVDLQFGPNTIILNCCCTFTRVTLEYKLRNASLVVLPLYIICDCHHGNFQAPKNELNTPQSACKRITTACKLIQSLFAEKLHDAGFSRKTFEIDPSGCVIFKSKLHYERAHEMEQMELWYYFAREIMNSELASNNRKYLAFLSCTDYDGSKYFEGIQDHKDLVKLTKSYVAFGGSGLALLGTACLYTWPENVEEIEWKFTDSTIVNRRQFLDDSAYRGTLGGCFATSLGAVVHELCHTFDLGHTEAGIMGRNFSNIQNVFLLNQTNDAVLKPRLKYKYKFHKPDGDTNWTQSCLVILNYHRWFNNFPEVEQKTLWYNRDSKIVKSTIGLRVLQLRRKSDEMVLKDFIFLDKIFKYSFQILYNVNQTESLIIFVEDNKGNILKEDF